MLKYKKMSLFDAPPGSILMHACNAQGVWGRGIAAEFKRRFPASYKEYVADCTDYINDSPLWGAAGKSLFLNEEGGYQVCCLVTSYDYTHVDDKKTILMQTVMALEDFCVTQDPQHKSIYCNKFNSGLFAVPWEETASILKYFEMKYNLDITVCEL